MSDISADDLYEEFTDYQTLCDEDIKDVAWKEVRRFKGRWWWWKFLPLQNGSFIVLHCKY